MCCYYQLKCKPVLHRDEAFHANLPLSLALNLLPGCQCQTVNLYALKLSAQVWKKRPGILQRATLRKWAVNDEGSARSWHFESAFIQCVPSVITRPPLLSSLSRTECHNPFSNTHNKYRPVLLQNTSMFCTMCSFPYNCLPSGATVVWHFNGYSQPHDLYSDFCTQLPFRRSSSRLFQAKL